MYKFVDLLYIRRPTINTGQMNQLGLKPDFIL